MCLGYVGTLHAGVHSSPRPYHKYLFSLFIGCRLHQSVDHTLDEWDGCVLPRANRGQRAHHDCPEGRIQDNMTNLQRGAETEKLAGFAGFAWTAHV